MNLSGNPIDFIFAFLGGLLASFTPCVYPLIPVSAGAIGLRSGGSRSRGLFLSLFYVGGIAATYSLLGLIASLTGALFGRVSSSPAAYFTAGAAVIVFAFFMSGLLTLPSLGVRLPGLFPAKGGGFFSLFLMGAASGLVISPCLTPVLGSILAYLAAKKSLLYGALLLFSFAYGMGFILIIAGTFGSLVLSLLPKSGRWMVYVKKFYALLLCTMGIYFIYIGMRRL